MLLLKLRNILNIHRYRIYTRPFELNIVGLRSDNTQSNRFDDEIHVFFRDDRNKWHHYLFKATTDPGTYWLNNPMQPQGTAILAAGQYEGAYQLGYHQGKYLALVQRKPVTVIRDYDRNATLDFFNGTQTTGLYGINIHRAMLNGTTKSVDKHSAGCQVFSNINDYLFFLKLCERHGELYGNQFTYTLIDFRAIRRMNLRYTAYGAGFLTLAALSYWCFHEYLGNSQQETQPYYNDTTA